MGAIKNKTPAEVMLCYDTPAHSAGYAEAQTLVAAANSSGPTCMAKELESSKLGVWGLGFSSWLRNWGHFGALKPCGILEVFRGAGLAHFRASNVFVFTFLRPDSSLEPLDQTTPFTPKS